MKNILLIATILISTMAMSQLQGEITYITKKNMHRDLPNDERGDRMREHIPEFVEFKNQLLFTSTETVYKNIPTPETTGVDLNEQDRRKQHMMKRMAPANDVIYCNVEEGLIVEKREFMDKVFLIRDTLNLSQWKMTGEMKEVSGMNCMKATYIPKAGDSTQIEVWFTPEIAISSGPAGYGGLPGLIVFVDVNNGALQISIASTVMREIGEGEIEKPEKGKVVTMTEFDEMRKKKMEQLSKQREGQGGPGRGGPPR